QGKEHGPCGQSGSEVLAQQLVKPGEAQDRKEPGQWDTEALPVAGKLPGEVLPVIGVLTDQVRLSLEDRSLAVLGSTDHVRECIAAAGQARRDGTEGTEADRLALVD